MSIAAFGWFMDLSTACVEGPDIGIHIKNNHQAAAHLEAMLPGASSTATPQGPAQCTLTCASASRSAGCRSSSCAASDADMDSAAAAASADVSEDTKGPAHARTCESK